MDRTYVEILAACLNLYQKANQRCLPADFPAQKDIESFQEALNKIEALMTLHADKREEFPLVDIIQHYEMDKNERAIIYFMVGAQVSRAPVKFEAFKMLLSGGEQTAFVLLNLNYFSSISKFSQKKIWLPLPGTPLLNFDLYRRICCFPKEKPIEKEDDPAIVFHKAIASPNEIYEALSKYVIGQDAAKRALSVAGFRHYHALKQGKNFAKANVLLIGNTGVGKTLLVNTLADFLQLPVVFASMTQFSETGYVGRSVSEILFDLMAQVQGNRKKAEQGIVFLDELDKIAATQARIAYKDVGGRSVQEELLGLLECDKETTFMPAYNSSKEAMIMNPGRILFIAAGAFEGIETMMASKKTPVGFLRKDTVVQEKHASKIEREELVKFGLIPELIGRFGLIATLSSLTEDDMVHIMTRSEKSCLKEYQRYFADFGKQLIFTEKALRLIAKKAMQENIGARGIKSVMEEILNPYLFSLGTDDLSENIIIDADKEEFLLESAEEKGVGMREEMAIT